MKKWIVIILLYAAVLRLFLLTEHPSGFHIDEVTLGYNSYSLLHTGRDETGKLWPLYSTSFGLDRALGNFLLVAGSIAALGLNEFAVRFPFSVAGILSVYFVYLLAREIIRSEKYALLAAFFVTVSPWHLNIVRASSEASVSLMLILLGQWMLLKHRDIFLRAVAISSILLSVFFYHAAVGFLLFSAPVSALLLWLQTHSLKRRFHIATSHGVFVSILLIFLVYGGGGTGRFAQVGFMKDPAVTNEQNKMFYEEGPQDIRSARTYHNKIVTYTRALIRNYFSYFTVDYLALQGGKPPRYSPPAMGLVYPLVLPLVLIGVYFLWRHGGLKRRLLVLLFFISPVIAALTYEYAPNVQRAFFMVPYMEMIAAYGMYRIVIARRNPQMISAAFSVLTAGCMVYYLHQYYRHFPVHDPLYRNDGARELVSFLSQYSEPYDYMVITNDPEPPYHYVLFFTAFDPRKFQENYTGKSGTPGGWLFENRLFFSTERCPSRLRNPLGIGSYVYVDNGECPFTADEQEQFAEVHEITRKDGSVLYRMLREIP